MLFVEGQTLLFKFSTTMSYGALVIIFLNMFLWHGICNIVFAKDNCGTYISGEVLDSLSKCKGFDKSIVNADNFRVFENENGDGSKILQGYFDVTQDVVEGDTLQLEAWKVTDLGQEEFEMTMGWDICSNIKNKDAPSYLVLESMGITQCPIKANKYECNDLQINLNSLQGKLDEEMCGTHHIHLKIVNGLKEKACLMMPIGIYEKQEEC